MAWVGCCLQLAFLFWALPVLIQSGRRKEFPRVFACFHTGICVGGRATRSARLCTSLPIHPSSRSQPRFDLGALHKILRIPTRTPTVFLPTLVVRITSMQVYVAPSALALDHEHTDRLVIEPIVRDLALDIWVSCLLTT
ncbi:hypothetical protein GW17_00028398 [Ensete ventricosum]|uniref:Uncharacterized protein n=1 Tax=Ensete ventricosum TaxID=4639 RepID=A0A426YU15_ENSVE|nr:hypothetical protein B296_00021600 [Ensete ventricosum]RWW08177.1 hypothetical protein GW17_00028398 [Ensete ventricosum]